MNKEKLLQLVSEAVDKGANFHIHMSQYAQSDDQFIPVDKETANEYILRFQEAVGTTKEIKNDTEGQTHGFSFYNGQFYVACSYAPVKGAPGYMIEDVNLSGGEEDAIA